MLAAFSLLLFAQILFIIKTVHTYVSIAFEMSIEHPKYEEETVRLTTRRRSSNGGGGNGRRSALRKRGGASGREDDETEMTGRV